MRRRMVVAGAVILLIGVAALAGGLYLLVEQSGLGNLAVTSQKTTVVLAPGATATIGATQTGQATIVDYSNNASAPIQVTSSGATTIAKTGTTSGEKVFVAVFVTLGTGPAPIVMQNNQTATLSVQYATAQSSIGALAYGGLLLLGGGGLFIVGLIVLILGLVLRGRAPPTPQ
ncbi:MAG: hypothetical protein JRM99_02805 [Nitrososphaerota archaeon]|nr:hypothetical protein [Nitrososphaerota archaeon]